MGKQEGGGNRRFQREINCLGKTHGTTAEVIDAGRKYAGEPREMAKNFWDPHYNNKRENTGRAG